LETDQPSKEVPSRPRTRFTIVASYVLTVFAVIVQLSCAVVWVVHAFNPPVSVWVLVGFPLGMVPAVSWLIHTGFSTQLVVFPYSTLGWLTYAPELPHDSRPVRCAICFPGLQTHGKLGVDLQGCTIKVEMVGTFRVTWKRGGTIEWLSHRKARVSPSRDCPLKYEMVIYVYFWEDVSKVRC
jgi:hypothetical protein